MPAAYWPVRWLVVFAFAWGVGCGGKAVVRRPGATYITEIRIEGNQALDRGELVPHLALDRTRRDGRGVDPYQLSLDTSRIRAAYLKRGFFDVQVDARVVGEAGPQQVIFKVVEGPRAKIQVVITGLPPDVPEAEARALIPLADGAPFDYDVYDLAKQPLLALVESAGYAHAELDAAVTADQDTRTTVARYAFVAGPRCTFGAVTIEGASGDLHDAIVGRLALAAGDTYSPKAITDSQRAILELGRFSTVRLLPDRSDPTSTVIPVTITVTRGSRGELKLGGGAGYDPIAPELRLRGGISHIPEALPLWTFGIESRIALTYRELEDLEPKIRVLVSGQRLELFRPRVIGDVGVGLDYFTVEAYTSTGPFAQLGLTLPFARWLQFRAGWSLTLLSFDDISEILDPAAITFYGLDRDRRLGAFQQTLVADFRDQPANPRLGLYFGMRLAEGTRYAGGEYEYLQLTPDLRGYVPLGPFVFAARARAGTILGDVPITERYFAGGAQSQRGFSYRQLAPSVVGELDGERASVLIGGDTSFETSLEVRATVAEYRTLPIVASVFLDGADVVDTDVALFDRQLHWAVGVGGAIDVGGIKFRVDIGHRLNRKGPGEPSYRPDAWFPNSAIHLGIGDAF